MRGRHGAALPFTVTTSGSGASTVDVAADHDLLGLFVETQNFFSVSHLGEAELFCNLRTDLCGIAVDSLAATENDVVVANLLDGLGERVARSESISTTERAVRHHETFVGTAVQSFADNFGRLRETHRQHRNGGTRELVLQTKGLLQGVQVFGVEDRGQCGTIDGSLLRHGIGTHVSCIRYLLCKHNDFKTHNSLIRLYS